MIRYFVELFFQQIATILATAYKARCRYICQAPVHLWKTELLFASFHWDVNEVLPTYLWNIYPKLDSYQIYSNKQPIEPLVSFYWEYPTLDVTHADLEKVMEKRHRHWQYTTNGVLGIEHRTGVGSR